MRHRLRNFFEKHIKTIAMLITSLVFILWLLSMFIPALDTWIKDQNLINVVIIALITDILAGVIELKGRIPDETRIVSDNQLDANKVITATIFSKKPRNASLLELSSVTIDPIMENLKDIGCRIELLVQSPALAINEYQRRRISTRLEDLRTLCFRNYSNYEVRVYSKPGAIRGRLLEDCIVNVGWYTYSDDEIGIYGHNNALITAPLDTIEGRILAGMFRRAFNWLWNDPTTISLEEYLKQN